ncbi:OmpW family outer membrane protein [Rickettsia prowazekii]|uniref:Putative outer membrane protein RP075 n=2 Tax=Rickettsia prowazekii TaxID=782 RepID=Y075_RICPR|nr:OmpW family protein [Rickettsia prowazekii]Q9ZE71.2 RecName: Full=Putative outer membrane protein RP075; Flags: Precursor [Rickettsia prowazekii str. Madrid E]ADE29587.1 OmpW family outer-membrane protein [Rickettsia prowazekii str. Rp22]AFE48905.1 OmpW family outer-membrane protein [Rickettsia prowazekii str. Chernikova]AFE49750.1 OmpW family outer-membrane protein [Rickettsia prowazekii str. Katsinyian]AFE50594.1 OmpW family outer-membrane protein [Rickettsia prowazekii str. BuV67-CWPP]A
MLRIVKKLWVILFISNISINSFAKNIYDNVDDANYDSTQYYENEGSLLFKMRLGGIFASAKQKGLPTHSSIQAVSVGEVAKNGYGGDASTTIFFNNYLAAELSLGFNVLRTKYTSLAAVAHNYGVDNVKLGKHKPIYMIPATLTGQFHIAPYGGIRPYIGIGYHGSYMLTQATGLKIRNGYNIVGQIGVDFYAKDDTLINMDVRQFFLKPKLEYKPNLVGNKKVTSKVKLNPLIVSIGIGFTF